MLWLKQYKPEEFDDSVMNQNVLNTGIAVGDFAMGLFGPFAAVPFGEMLEGEEDMRTISLSGNCKKIMRRVAYSHLNNG